MFIVGDEIVSMLEVNGCVWARCFTIQAKRKVHTGEHEIGIFRETKTHVQGGFRESVVRRGSTNKEAGLLVQEDEAAGVRRKETRCAVTDR